MNVISDNRRRNGWVTAVIDDRWCQAKVFDLPSNFGINGGRVSKLAIMRGNKRDPHSDFLAQCDYNYDRGLDFDNLPAGTLASIVGQLEALPPCQ